MDYFLELFCGRRSKSKEGWCNGLLSCFKPSKKVWLFKNRCRKKRDWGTSSVSESLRAKDPGFDPQHHSKQTNKTGYIHSYVKIEQAGTMTLALRVYVASFF